MKKNILTVVLLLIVTLSFAQKGQRLAYIDMDYILQNIPEYIEAQNALNAKVEKWRNKLDKETRNIEVLKTDLANEKAILTKELIEEREEDIKIKQEALRRLESMYFGPNGDMFNLRKQLVQPVQDQVYNAVQDIASKKKYDFVFDKSSDLVMLYFNKKHDISDLIVKLIKIDQKQKNKKEKLEAKKQLLNSGKELNEKERKKEELRQRKLKQIEERKKQIEEKKKKIQEKKKKMMEQKKALLKEKEEKRKKKKEEAKEGSTENK